MKTPALSTVVSKLKLRNDRVLSIRTGKLAGTDKNGTRYIYIEGAYYKYDDIYALLRTHASISKPLNLPVYTRGNYQTNDGDKVRIYATDGTGLYCVHGAYEFNRDWFITTWSLDGKNVDHECLNLQEVK